MMVSFDTTADEKTLINKILNRAKTLGLFRQKRLEHNMDLAAANANGCPIDFARFLNATEEDFTHDFIGIYRNINVDTGQFNNGFRPRFAKHEDADTCNQNTDAA